MHPGKMPNNVVFIIGDVHFMIIDIIMYYVVYAVSISCISLVTNGLLFSIMLKSLFGSELDVECLGNDFTFHFVGRSLVLKKKDKSAAAFETLRAGRLCIKTSYIIDFSPLTSPTASSFRALYISLSSFSPE